jgi:hypothetical protein
MTGACSVEKELHCKLFYRASFLYCYSASHYRNTLTHLLFNLVQLPLYALDFGPETQIIVDGKK